VFLGLDSARSGTMHFMLVESGEDVIRRDFVPRPITLAVIAKLNELAANEAVVLENEVCMLEAEFRPITSLLILINLLASDSRLVMVCIEIKAAFLHAKMIRTVYVRLNRATAKLWVKMKPDDSRFVLLDGTIVARADKCIYGLVDSPRLWKQTFDLFLSELGFEQCKLDLASYNVVHPSKPIQALVCHVDDSFVIASQEMGDKLVAKFEEKFGPGGKVQTGSVVEHLGMVIRISENRKVSVSQPAYARKIVKLFGLEQSEVVETPYFADLFLAHADSPALQNVAMFQSQLMSLAFLTRTRPELRVGIAALSVFQQHPTERHLEQLVAMAKFVNGTLDAGLEFEPSNMQLRGSVDAAFGNHMDFKSHTGILLWFGVRNAPVEAISKKQTITSRSSTESEMVALCAGSENAL
jgi:hypothetical protein